MPTAKMPPAAKARDQLRAVHEALVQCADLRSYAVLRCSDAVSGVELMISEQIRLRRTSYDHGLMAVFSAVHLPLTHVPTAPIVVITATTRMPRRTVYSMSAAPSSSLPNLATLSRNLRITEPPKNELHCKSSR